MIPDSHANHRASYDSDGNIILPGMSREPETRADVQADMQEGIWHTPSEQFVAEDIQETEEVFVETPIQTFEVIEETIETVSIAEHTSEVWQTVREQMYTVTSSAVTEAQRQYGSTAKNGHVLGREAMGSLRRSARSTWRFLTQPVWVPGKRNQPKQYSRGTLFALDTVRFGGTFAALFTLLFVGLNYQSFWAIAESYVDPLAEVTGMKPTTEDKALARKLKNIPALAVAGRVDGSIADYLPPVGPPENRLIIPKLDLNVPIKIPPNEALLREDWKNLEEDIQYALQDGVVHYPGTARPGKPGNFFVTGHSSYFPWAPGDFKSVFARLHDLNVGDEYWVFYGGDRHRYVVKEKKEIKPSDVTVLDQPSNKRISTLMTCTPVGTTLRRLILIAQEIDPVTGEELEIGEHGQEDVMPKLKMQALPI